MKVRRVKARARIRGVLLRSMLPGLKAVDPERPRDAQLRAGVEVNVR